MNQTSPAICGAHLCPLELAAHSDVACLGSLGALFDIELDPLALLQIAIPIALNGREMDENVLAAFTLDETETLITIEPLHCTSYTFRHCFCLLWAVLILGILFVPSEDKTKQLTQSNRELWLFF
jgi:hypothetical protein